MTSDAIASATDMARTVRRQRLLASVAVGVPSLCIIVFFFGPMLWLVAASLSTHEIGAAPRLTFTLENYAQYLGDSFYLISSVWKTIYLSVLATLLSLVAGYVLAYWIAGMEPAMRGKFLAIIVVSLSVNTVIRIFGLNVLLMNNGLINQSLIAIGLIERPLRLMYSETGVLIGLVQISLPYIVVPLIGVLTSIDPSLREAASSVGANRFRTFWAVTFPLSIPGVVAGTLITFTLNVSAFSIPAMMGGGRVRMMGVMTYQQASVLGNFPFAATIGMVLFLLTMIITLVYLYAVSRLFRKVS